MGVQWYAPVSWVCGMPLLWHALAMGPVPCHGLAWCCAMAPPSDSTIDALLMTLHLMPCSWAMQRIKEKEESDAAAAALLVALILP